MKTKILFSKSVIKHFTAVSACLLLCLCAFGQINPNKQQIPGNQLPANIHHIDKAQVDALKNQNGFRRATQQIVLDYDAVDAIATANSGGVYDYLIWSLNSRYSTADTTIFGFQWAVVVFDTLYDANTLSAIPYNSTNVLIDSVRVYAAHQNVSATPDTVQITVYNYEGGAGLRINNNSTAQTGQQIINQVLYDTTIVTTTSLTGGANTVGAITVTPNLLLPAGQKFLVGVHYYGSVADTFNILAGYGERCGGACASGQGSSPSVFDLNSLYRLIVWSGSANLTGVNSIAYDCDGDGIAGESLECEEFSIQNFGIAAYVTVDALLITTASTPATCGLSDGTATVSVVGGAGGNYTYQWSPVSGIDSFLTGLAPGTYYVTVTDTSGKTATASIVVSGSCGTISGNVFDDRNGNGIKDAGENGLFGLPVDINPGGYAAFSDQNGDYTVDVATYDTFTVEITPSNRNYCSNTVILPDSISFPSTMTYQVIINAGFTLSNGNDFGIAPRNVFCGSAGLYPSPDSFPCIQRGQSFSETIEFSNLVTIGGIDIEWLTIDSITGLPSGISASIFPDNYFSGIETGLIVLSGTTNDVVGTYTITIYVTVKLTILPDPASGPLDQLTQQFGIPGYGYYVHVINSGAACAFSGLYVLSSSIPSTCGNSDGAASVEASGGSGVYSYQWSPVSGTDSFLTNLPPGTYSVVVTDDSTGAVVTKNIVVTVSCGTVSGNVFDDANKNGIKDASENGIAGVRVNVVPGGYTKFTNQNGDYTISIPSLGTYDVQVVAPMRYYCSGTLLSPDSVSFPSSGEHTVIISATSLDTTAIDFGLASPAVGCGTVMGYVFEDLNANGIDDGEPRMSGVMVDINNSQLTVTDFYGMYSVDVPFNTPVTVSIYPSPFGYFCGTNQTYYTQTFPPFNGNYTVTVTPGSPVSTGNDFGVNNTGGAYDVGIYNISADAGNQAGMNFYVWMDYKADGNPTDTCYLRLTFDPLVQFISADVAPATVTNTYVEWAYPPGGVPAFYCMVMEFVLSPSAAAGTVLTWTGTYNCGSPDGCPGNDTMVRVITVITGPLKQEQNNGLNSMNVYHTGDAQELTNADSSFSYVIFFQNTGTDTTYNLTIVDTLSPYLNNETVSRPFSSDAYQFCMPASNIMIWEFPNINLPDSATDFQHSYGFVQYNIFMKPNLPPGTVIEQRAAVSFNHEEPYITNEVSVSLKEPDDTTGIGDLLIADVNIYPNPGSGVFKIVLPEKTGNDYRVKVYDVMGAMVLEKVLAENSTNVFELNIGEHPDGLYFMRIESGEKSWRGKVFLMR